MKPYPKYLHISLSLILVSSECLSASLSYTELSGGVFELILEHDLALEIQQAQSAMYQSAVQLCKGKKPLYGKYKFESTEPVSNEGEGAKYYFLQRITCADEVSGKVRIDKPTLSQDQEEMIKASTREHTDDYFSAKENGNFRTVYEMLTPEMQQISDYPSWVHREDSHYKKLGKLISRDIKQITIYNNPENSPKPGLYLAADYESKYEKSTIICGFVIWYLPEVNSNEYRVMREEYGSINKENMEKMKPEELQNVRSKIGCKDF
jgi:hypothetical protein